ncbi:MAG: tape measure protein, partial [bacterium]
YTRELKYHSKLQDDQQKASDKASADAKAAANKKWVRDLKFNSKIQEDQQKASDKASADAKAAANKKWVRDLKFNSKVQKDQQKSADAAKNNANKKYIKDLKFNSKVQDDQQKSASKAQEDRNKRYLKMLKYNSKVMEDQQRAEAKAAKAAQREQAKLQRQAARDAKSRSRSGAGSSGLGAGLTARADIYMHANALRSLVQSGRGMFDVYAAFQESTAALRAFTGGAKEANAMMQELQTYAQQTPYDLASLADATRNMMAAGVGRSEVVDIIQNIGAVAGGNVERLNRLAYVMSQVATTGRLLGQDLMQMQQQGFNPLLTIAERTVRANQSVKDRMIEL